MSRFEYLPISYRAIQNQATHKLFHGSRGGGKTTTLLGDFAKNLNRGFARKYKGYLFRTQYEGLTEVKERCREIYGRYYGATFTGEQPMKIKFPQGETLNISIMKGINQEETLIGKEIPWIGFDEITMLADKEVFTNLTSANRTTLPIKARISATCNPWGVGRDWVKKLFRIGEFPSEHIHLNEYKQYCSHIFSNLTDNKYILNAVGGLDYVRSLASYSEAKRQAWCFGNWDFIVGGFLETSWSPQHQIVKPFRIPSTWECFRSFDWGYSSPFSVGYYCISDGQPYKNQLGLPVSTIRGDVFKIYEIYGGKYKTKYASKKVGLEWSNPQIAKKIKEVDLYLQSELNIRVSGGVADDQIFAEKNNNNIASQFEKEGIFFKPADKSSRINSASILIDMLTSAIPKPNRARENNAFYIWDNCLDTIRTLPQLQRCEIRLDDISQKPKQEDHAFDQIRYALAFAKSEKRVNMESYFRM